MNSEVNSPSNNLCQMAITGIRDRAENSMEGGSQKKYSVLYNFFIEKKYFCCFLN
jgi:hypothetical protein